MTELIMQEDIVETTPEKVETTEQKDTYEYKTIEQDPMEMDKTPWLNTPPLSQRISSYEKPDLFLLMWS